MKQYKYSLYNIVVDNNEQYTTIYNSYSGGIIKLENEIYKSVCKGIISLNDIQYGQELLGNGFIVNNYIDEFNKVKMQLENVLSDRCQETISYVIAPTLNCNLNCVYCFQNDFRTHGSDNIVSDEMLDKIETYIIKSNSANKLLKKIIINWFGGEPLLCYDKIISFCKSIKEKLAKNGIEFGCTMVTNGILLDESRLKELANNCNLIRIQITLDGEEETYCTKKQTVNVNFDRVIKNICIATKYVRTTVRVNADKDNYSELLRLAQFLLQKDINKENIVIHFAQLRDYKNQSANYPFFNDLEFWQYKNKFYDSLKKYGCCENENNHRISGFSTAPLCGLARKSNFVIDYLGNLYKCEHCIGDKKKVVGNIEDGIYYNDVYLKSMTVPCDNRCKKCNIFPKCNYSRCSAMYGFTGDIYKCNCYEKQLEVIKGKVKKLL